MNILNFISRSSLDSFLLPKGDIISMSRNLPRRAFVGQIAFWPLMARRAMVNQTYTYNNLPAGYTYEPSLKLPKLLLPNQPHLLKPSSSQHPFRRPHRLSLLPMIMATVECLPR